MTKSGKKFSQAKRAEIMQAKIDEIAAKKADEERKARIAKIQAGWFALTA